MDKLKRYLSELHIQKNITLGEFAEILGITRAMLSGIKNGKATPSIKLVKKLYEYTGGDISPNDFYHFDEWKCKKEYSVLDKEG